jgi:hypothetical protein
MRLGLRAALFVGDLHWKRWERRTADPRAAQNELLLRILRRNQNTAFGRDHGFHGINSIGNYRSQVPIGDYERFRPYVKRASEGGRDVLTADPILMFALTSGSTGEPKLIPVTEATRASHSSLTKLWYSRAFHDHPGAAGGKVFGLVGAAVEGHTAGGIPYGAASGLIYQSSPWWIHRIRALPYAVAEIKNFEAKYYVAMRLALEQNVSFLGTPNPSTLLRLVDMADRHRVDMARDIHDGKLSDRFEVTGEIRAVLASRLGPNPSRARELEQFVKTQGRLRPIDYWPGLRLIGCWKGGSVGVRLKELEDWFGADVPTRDLGYMASEAQISLPIEDRGSAGILAIDANFYEFIPESAIGAANPITLGCDELEVGGVYYVIVTTAGGLYRYDINDLIRVAGFHGKTPLIEFLRKGRDVTNITGEKLHVNQVIQAMDQARIAATVAIRHFQACADLAQSRYAFMVEIVGAPLDKESLAHLLERIDAELCALNVEYAQKRESERLRPPVLCLMKPGWFERKANSAVERGGRDAQFKAKLLSDAPVDSSEVLFVIDNGDSTAKASIHRDVDFTPR